MLDLHIHSVNSDGMDTVLEILKKAEKLKLEMISITDHDSVGAYEDLKKIKIKNYYSGKIIPGIEAKTVFCHVPVEVLGYHIDIEKFKNSPCVDHTRKVEMQNRYLQNFIKVGRKLGIKSGDICITDSRQFAGSIYYDEIQKYPENFLVAEDLLNKTPAQFYRDTSGNRESPFYIDETEDNLPINFVIEEIHRCGGLAFLAHVFEYPVEHEVFLKELIETTKIDGIEAYHSSFTKLETERAVEFAKKHHKLISGGSDYHGINKMDINLGTGRNNMKIEKEMLGDWINKERK